MSVTGLPPGMYFLTHTGQGKKITRKFVKE
ncbi:MAG: T9SS type A sorting domain-containing protein [Bacteroidales bacterium]|nr:T9SS type A sorting domain-containing protein [Bacteroidales bacterium]